MKWNETIAAQEISRLMQGWLGPSADVEHEVREGGYELDLVVRHGEVTFIIEVKRTDDIAVINSARRHLARYLKSRPGGIGVLAVPHMGPKAREFARSQGLSWLDLSGNADIRGVGVRVLIEGKPNRFASPGRPSSAFTDKASRITRSMLVEPERWWRQAELIETTGLSSGYVSKVVSRLDEDDLLERQPDDGTFRPRSPDLILDAWAQVYDFRKHDIARFHVVGRTGAAVAESVARRLAEQPDLQWAATGLAGAWQLDRHADFRLATFLVSAPLLDPEKVGLRPVERGENLWIVVPKDQGVFHGSRKVSGIRCVHPVQVYLDLLGHPERAEEAAAHLRGRLFDSGGT